MTFFAKLKNRLRPDKRPPRQATRAFAGASHGRLTADWIAGATSANAELRASLTTLRNRCRDLDRNNGYFRGFLAATQTNVVGPRGIRLQMRVRNDDGTPDTDANRRIEESFAEWGLRGVCTMDGRLSWADAQRLFIRAAARDGEVIVRLVRGNRAGNEYGFAIQLLEADHLEEADDRDLRNGRRVRMGVEVNEWGRTLALHLLQEHPGEGLSALRSTGRRLRIPARDALHSYIVERAGQLRGLPWLASAITRLHQLGHYEEAELVASRVAASKMGFFEQREDADPAIIGSRQDGDLIMEAEPGQFEQLPAGYTFKSWDPQHPNSAFEAFNRAMLRGVAASVGFSYATISADLAQTNYSSLRQGALLERDMWRVLQDWMTEAFIRPVFTAWLEMAMTTGAVPLPVSKWSKFNRPTFQPRGWDWVDPNKEVQAAIAEIEMGLNTHSGVMAAKGRDLADVLAQKQAEQKLAAAHGVNLPQARPKGREIVESEGDTDAEEEE